MKKITMMVLFQLPVIVFAQMLSIDKNWNTVPELYDEFTGTRSWGENRVDDTGEWLAYYKDSGIKHDSTDIYCEHYNEHQVFQRENAIFETSSPGYMILRAKATPDSSGFWYPGSPYTAVTCPYDFISGAIETVDSFKYGYFEIKCSLPDSLSGNFPAFWLYSNSYGRYNEIDIFEHVIQNEPLDYKRFFGTYYYEKGNGIRLYDYFLTTGESALTSMHTYAVEWSPRMIIWYFDGKIIGSIFNGYGVPSDPMSLKVNYSLDDYQIRGDTSRLPLDMTVDYVKIYQLKSNCCNSDLSITNSTALNSSSISVRRNITVGTSSGTISVLSNGISLRATNSITINNNFVVPNGKQFFAVTHACPN